MGHFVRGQVGHFDGGLQELTGALLDQFTHNAHLFTCRVEYGTLTHKLSQNRTGHIRVIRLLSSDLMEGLTASEQIDPGCVLLPPSATSLLGLYLFYISLTCVVPTLSIFD